MKKNKSEEQRDPRAELMEEINGLAAVAIFGSASETYRTCGQAACQCHRGGPKHGPHMYVSYRGASGKTTGYYVPKVAHEQVRAGIDAWHTLQKKLKELAELNRQKLLASTKEEGS